MSILDVISIELSNLSEDELIDPGTEVSEQDTVVGVADIELRKLHSLWMNWEKYAAEKALEARYSQKRADQETLIDKALEFAEKSRVVKSIFWISVKDTFDLWNKPSIGIRQGWAVVWSKEEENPFRRIFGELGDMGEGLF